MLKKIFCMTFALLLCIPLLASCAKDENLAKVDLVDDQTDLVAIQVKEFGTIIVELDPDAAPITVENFKKLVSDGFYDGLIFHRVIKDFVIQGGDPLGNGRGGSDENIKGEFALNGVSNPLKHERGTISMARSGDPNSASSQFFICHQTNRQTTGLDGSYAAFGTVLYGMEVVDAIAEVQTNMNDKPLNPVVIDSIQFAKLK